MSALFTPITLGDYQLPNRIFMAPLTRARAGSDGVPSALMAEYYAQRASAGLIISEATAVSKRGLGWVNATGNFTDEQHAGWRMNGDAVHEKGGRHSQQLWHTGRSVNPDL